MSEPLTINQQRRRDAIIEAWSVDAQLEALTENAAGRPEKLQELLAFIADVKKQHPKPEQR
jgi:hypothetical protein